MNVSQLYQQIRKETLAFEDKALGHPLVGMPHPYLVSMFVLAVAFYINFHYVGLRETPGLLPFGAVMFSAWYGSIKTSLLSVLVSVYTLDVYFLHPKYTLLGVSEYPSLLAFIFIGIAISIIITLQKRSHMLLHRQAMQDHLTKLPNRRMLVTSVTQSMSEADRLGKQLAVMMLDLDKFKFVNDDYGHRTGDLLLTETARRINSVLRGADKVARWGGDEFIILGEIENVADCEAIVAKLVAAITTPYKMGDQQFSTSVSIGVSIYPTHGKDFQILVRNADSALYQVKKSGGNKYRIFDESLIDLNRG